MAVIPFMNVVRPPDANDWSQRLRSVWNMLSDQCAERGSRFLAAPVGTHERGLEVYFFAGSFALDILKNTVASG